MTVRRRRIHCLADPASAGASAVRGFPEVVPRQAPEDDATPVVPVRQGAIAVFNSPTRSPGARGPCPTTTEPESSHQYRRRQGPTSPGLCRPSASSWRIRPSRKVEGGTGSTCMTWLRAACRCSRAAGMLVATRWRMSIHRAGCRYPAPVHRCSARFPRAHGDVRRIGLIAAGEQARQAIMARSIVGPAPFPRPGG